MMRARPPLTDDRGTSAAEFALVLPVFLLLLLGTIDVGRWMWNVGQAEKATMMGARYAVVTDMVPSDLFSYSFAVSGGIPSGQVVPEDSVSDIACGSDGTAVTCSCVTVGTCLGANVNQDAFNRVVARMASIYGGVRPENVRIDYAWSGLGFAGDPNGSDVDPIVTVRLVDLPFRPISLGALGNLGLPGTSHSLTMEDGVGDRGF